MAEAKLPIVIEQQEVIIHNLDNCPWFMIPIKGEKCLEQTQVLLKNIKTCFALKCQSAHRRCITCLSEGKWQSGKTIVVDFEKGLCADHLKESADRAAQKVAAEKAARAIRMP